MNRPIVSGNRMAACANLAAAVPSPSAFIQKAQRPSRKTFQFCARASDGDRASDGASPLVPDAVPTVMGDIEDADWRAFRAKLVASSSGTAPPPVENTVEEEVWAHHLPSPEEGCLLLASPLFFSASQQYFHQSVILVISHGPGGTAGLILNKPTQHRLGSFKDSGSSLPAEFDECTLYLGGDVGDITVNIVHGVPGVQHSVQIFPGVYLGGLEGLRAALASGEARPEDIKVLTRQAGWAPGQLEEEVARGVWYPVAASKQLALSPWAALSGGELWHTVMQLMGGEYAQLSAAVRGEFRADIMGIGGSGGSGGAVSYEVGGENINNEVEEDDVHPTVEDKDKNLPEEHDNGSGI